MRVKSSAGLALLLIALAYGQLQRIPGIEVKTHCLGCICEAVSSCNGTLSCDGETCGAFRITRAYWIDAGKITPSADLTDGYQACTLDPQCAAQVVRSYMARFAQDCNGDGVVNCDDFAAIHRLGGYGCKGPLDQLYLNKYFSCKKQNLALGNELD